MPTSDPNQTQAPDIQWARRHFIAVIALACVGSFAAGYLTSLRSHCDRVRAEGRRQSDEFLSGAMRLGIVLIDRERLSVLADESESSGWHPIPNDGRQSDRR